MNIFDLITASEVASYYTTKAQEQAPYLAETLFNDVHQRTRHIEWMEGEQGAPVSLQPSALGTTAIVRGRKGFEKIQQDAFYFKEGKYIDEELRQELLLVQNSNNQAYADMIMNRIFDDQIELISGARVGRERMRMQLLLTGQIDVSGNDQHYTVNYGMPSNHIVQLKNTWDDLSKSNPFDDLQAGINTIATDQGTALTRYVMNRKTWNMMLRNEQLKATLNVNNANTAQSFMLSSNLNQFVSSELGLSVQIYDKIYLDDDGITKKPFIPNGVVLMLPSGDIGRSVFATTPEEADLIGISGTANISMVDMGVAVSTITSADPVQIKTNVSQYFVPSFEQGKSVYVMHVFSPDAVSAADKSTTANAEPYVAPTASSATQPASVDPSKN